MSDFPTPPADPSFGDAFNNMEASLSDVPEGSFITLRHNSGSPVFVPLEDGEQSLTVRQVIDRAGLTIGIVNFYVDQTPITLDTPVAAGTVITAVGNVKGG